MTDIQHKIRASFSSLSLEAYATDKNCEAFACLLSELLAFNAHTNLTAITDPEEIVLRHFADCVTVADSLPPNASVIDVGCGGGFPTLPLAIVRPDLHITALDSTAKKLVFVDAMAKKLGLKVETLAKRAEELPECRERYDVCVSRAVARLNLLAELCLPLVRVGGSFIAMKGAGGEEELAEAESGIAVLGGKASSCKTFTLSSAGERCLVTVEKIAPTPTQYPRPWGKMKKKPL